MLSDFLFSPLIFLSDDIRILYSVFVSDSIFLDYGDGYYLFSGPYEGIFYCPKENLVRNSHVSSLIFPCLIN